MDETIGAKGGRNDRRKTRIIKNKKQKDKETIELEKKVKKQQFRTFIKTLPLIIGTAPIYTISDALKKITKKEETKDSQQEPVEIIELEEKTIQMPTGEMITIRIPKTKDKKEERKISLEQQSPKKEDKKIDEKQEKTTKDQPQKETEMVLIPLPQETINRNQKDIQINTSSDIHYEELPNQLQQKLEKLKSRKIVEEYEKVLKDIRYDLRNTVYEYEVLKEEQEEVVLSKEAEIILEKLSDVIDKLEELKRKIKIDNLDKYDDNYIYYLIESYFSEFQNGKAIKELKDSPLYIMIAEKITEMDQKKSGLYKKVEEKKTILEQKEQSFEELKKKYASIDKVNKELLSFQYDQEQLLQEIREKVRTASSTKERVQTEIQGLNKQSKILLNLLTLQMLLRGPRSAKAVAASTAAYLYFMNNVVKPKRVTKRYQVITVKDYKDLIKGTIEELDSAKKLLSKTSSQIDKIMKEMKEKYKDYIGVVPEWDEMFYNLKRIKQEVEEKEYEMEKLKNAQLLELEKNNAKVKTRGEYPVN